MSSMRYSRVIDELTVVIIAADLSTELQNRGMGRSNPHLREIACGILTSDSTRNKGRSRDAQQIADAVWYDHVKPKLLAMLGELCDDKRYCERIIDRHFKDGRIERRG